jgi:hypothetical protein
MSEDGQSGEPEVGEPEIDEETAKQLLSDPPAEPAQPKTTFTQADVERIVKQRLERERSKYADYGDLKAKAAQAKTVEQQLEELRTQLGDRDKRDLERNGRLAVAQLNTRLAEAGIKGEDVAGLVKRLSPADLLVDGEPDDKAIAELAESLVKVAGRATPDPDQGKKGGKAPLDMNQLIRRAAGIS